MFVLIQTAFSRVSIIKAIIMKRTLCILSILLFCGQLATAQDIIELEPSQFMCIAGKGPGQDGAINPYLGSDTIATVENLGENSFFIRIQTKGKLLKRFPIDPKDTKEVTLLKDQVLYFDSDKKTTVSVSFRKIED